MAAQKLKRAGVVLAAAGIAAASLYGLGPNGALASSHREAPLIAADPTVECIVFGHSHQPLSQLRDGVILFNPGSPTDRRRQRYFSFGLLRIGETIEPELVYFLPW